jgi:putative ABC transport system permease protein
VIGEGFRAAWSSLRSHTGRTALTAFSVAIGAGAIALMVSLSQSGIATISHGLEDSGGARLIFVANKQPSDFKPYYWDRGLPTADADAVRERVPGTSMVAFLLPPSQAPLRAGGTSVETNLMIGSSWMELMNMHLIAGRNIPDDAEKDISRVTVLAKPLATHLFGTVEGALGKTIEVYRHRYSVIGVAEEGDTPGFSMNDGSVTNSAFFSSPVMIKSEGFVDDGFIIIKDDGHTPHEDIISVANNILQRRHHDADDVEFNDFAVFIGRFNAISTGLRVITGLIAAISLIIAGAGIMNVLLASVRQRISEIGIRRAVGATQSDILTQFVIEAGLVGVLGGLVGAGTGLLGAMLANRVLISFIETWNGKLSYAAALVAIFVASVSGLVFGIHPARRAAKLDVIACLRGDAL